MRLILVLLCIIFSLSQSINLKADDAKKNIDLTVGSHKGAGLFCELRKVVSSIIHYEGENFCSIFIDWTSPYFPYKDDFADQVNGWDLFFEPIKVESSNINNSPQKVVVQGSSFHEIHGDCSAQWVQYDGYLPYRLYVKKIIDKYLKIQPFILDKVNEFYDKYMAGYLCIGVQVRHSRHVENRASLQEYAQEIDFILKKYADEKVKVFVASDSNEPIRYLKKIFGEKIVYTDAWRKEGNLDPVFDSPNFKVGFVGGVGALMDCLLLAKCSYFIHIISNMANFVSFYNPYIKSVFLPRKRPYKRCDGLNKKDLKNPYLIPVRS